MKIIDPGHGYALDILDKQFVEYLNLSFVKRQGEHYPGNIGHYPGTTLQECWRAEIDRLKYLNKQIPYDGNRIAISNLRQNISLLELRAAERHHREVPRFIEAIEHMVTCPKCLHIGCNGNCREE